MLDELFCIELAAPTLEGTVKLALERWDCCRSDFEMDPLQTPRRPFFGLFGGKPARAFFRLTDRGIIAGKIAEHLLFLCGLEVEVEVQRGSSLIEVNVHQGQTSLVIGSRGQNLEALQWLVVALTDRFCREDRTPIVIDADNYRERRKKKVQGWARSLCREVKKKGGQVTVPNVFGSDRRYFKETLQEEVGIEYRIVGHGNEKKMVLFPKRGQP